MGDPTSSITLPNIRLSRDSCNRTRSPSPRTPPFHRSSRALISKGIPSLLCSKTMLSIPHVSLFNQAETLELHQNKISPETTENRKNLRFTFREPPKDHKQLLKRIRRSLSRPRQQAITTLGKRRTHKIPTLMKHPHIQK